MTALPSSSAGMKPESAFREQANGSQPSLPRELFDLLRVNKRWWLLPVLGSLLAVGVLVVLGGGAAAPFIYTLF